MNTKKTEQCFCQSYYDNLGLQDCTCGKCGKTTVSAREEFKGIEMFLSLEIDKNISLEDVKAYQVMPLGEFISIKNVEKIWNWIEKNFTHNSDLERIKLEAKIEALENTPFREAGIKELKKQLDEHN